MRKDICHYYEKGLREVFDAYYLAATQKFGRDCKIEPLHTLTFGLNYSIKYNMNGGACTIHFMPYQTGTAVDVRYSVVQLAGARCKAHDKDLSDYVVGVLQVQPQDCNIPIESFLLPENQKTMADLSEMGQPQAAPAFETPAPAPELPKATPHFCWRCGAHLDAEYTFCPKCGGALKAGAEPMEEPEVVEDEPEVIPEPEEVVEEAQEVILEPEEAAEPEPEPEPEIVAEPEPIPAPEVAQAAPKFCRHCGAHLDAEYAFCPKCGGVLKAPEAVREEPVVESEPEVVDEPAPVVEAEELSEPEVVEEASEVILEHEEVVEDEPEEVADPEPEIVAEPEPIPASEVAQAAPKFCRHCGAHLDREYAFCPDCGGLLKAKETPKPTPAPEAPKAAPKFCRHCGTPLDKDTPFCPQCGGKLR